MKNGDIRHILKVELDSPTRILDIFEADADVPIKSINNFAKLLGCQVSRYKKKTFVVCGDVNG